MQLIKWIALSAALGAVTIETAVATTPNYRGVTPELQRKLAGATTFTCDEGTKKFPVERLNDNYCDCDDGSDEPGTSACSHTNAQFHCQNHGYYATNLPTSRVNDHICDCCDGSDEYASEVTCPVTCGALMETFMNEKRGQLEIYEAGRQERLKLVEKAAQLIEADEKRVAELDVEIQDQKKTIADLERTKQEEELLETKEKMDGTKSSKLEMMKALGLLDLTPEQLGRIILELTNTMYNKDDLVRFIRVERDEVGLGKSPLEEDEVAWQTREDARQVEAARIQKLIDDRDAAKRAKEEAKEQARKEAEERGETVVEEEEEEQTGEDAHEYTIPEVEERPVSTLFAKMSAFNGHVRPEATAAREAHAAATGKLSSLELDRTKLTNKVTKLAQYGPDRVLYALREECFSTQGGQYTYQMCFFGQAKQDSTSLGTMQTDTGDEPTKTVSFTGGTTCWNGPSRSLRVTLECGAEAELYNVEEPSTCVYTATLKTPVACDEAYKAALMGNGQQGGSVVAAHHIEMEVSATTL